MNCEDNVKPYQLKRNDEKHKRKCCESRKNDTDDIRLNPKCLICLLFYEEGGYMKSRKKNKYVKKDEYYIGYCNNRDKQYIVDSETYEKIKDYNCYCQRNMILLYYEGRTWSLAKLICGVDNPNNSVLHKNKNSMDYRKNNLYFGNEYYIYEDKVVGKCFDEQEFIVDREDYDLIKDYKWHIDIYGYVLTKTKINGKVRTIKMHRLLMDVLDNNTIEIDHINRNGSDNRRSNLRFADRELQLINTGLSSRNKSGVKGVYWMKSAQKWAAQIKSNHQTHYLGCYNSIEEAIKARQEAEKIYHKI